MPETLTLMLRILSGTLLVLFSGALFVLIWRDYRAAAHEIESRHRRRGRLIIVSSETDGLEPGSSYPLLPLTSIGRAPTNTIPLEDAFASSEHALFTLRGGQWWLEDRGSANGTLLNGEKLEEPTVVSSGDVVCVGRVELKLELE